MIYYKLLLKGDIPLYPRLCNQMKRSIIEMAMIDMYTGPPV